MWDLDTVREWSDVKKRVDEGEKAHVGDVFGICVLKGSELPPGIDGRKYKGRFVFRGNMVKDEKGDFAIFNDLSSSPASMESSKVVDAYGLIKGHVIQQSDAKAAYTQAEMGTEVPQEPFGPPVKVTTWVRLPKDLRPAWWADKYHDPVCANVG